MQKHFLIRTDVQGTSYTLLAFSVLGAISVRSTADLSAYDKAVITGHSFMPSTALADLVEYLHDLTTYKRTVIATQDVALRLMLDLQAVMREQPTLLDPYTLRLEVSTATETSTNVMGFDKLLIQALDLNTIREATQVILTVKKA